MYAVLLSDEARTFVFYERHVHKLDGKPLEIALQARCVSNQFVNLYDTYFYVFKLVVNFTYESISHKSELFRRNIIIK